jgi:catechol 2,3-dioxygenase-like lactoylglutathione lyase family enzyme
MHGQSLRESHRNRRQPGHSLVNLNQVTLPTTRFERSVAFYRGLGFILVVHAPPRYARFECPDGDSTFSLHSVDALAASTGVVVYFECADLDRRVADLLQSGFEFSTLPTDEPWLWREARLADPSGNVICLYHAGDNRKYPPWRVAG